MFTTTPFLHNALKEEPEYDILQYPATTKQYTLLLPKTLPVLQYEEPLEWLYLDENPVFTHFVSIHLRQFYISTLTALCYFLFQLKKCECNQITDLRLMDDANQENVINILAKWHCICGKKVCFPLLIF